MLPPPVRRRVYDQMVAIIAAVAQTSVNRIVTIVNIGFCEWRSSHRRYCITLR